jgi:putative transposase
MILTYKLRHDRDFSSELEKARKVAEYAVEHKKDFKALSTKHVKHIGLKSIIANQILRKYGRNKQIKQVRKVNLIIPNQGIKVNKIERTIEIPSLKLKFDYQFPRDFEKVNQIEINREFVFVSVTVLEEAKIEPDKWVGVDLNTTGHCAVLADPDSGKVVKMGKAAEHIHRKYKNIRRRLQKQGKYKKVKQIKNRESRIVRNLNHKISKKVVDYAKKIGGGIKLEKLRNIRKTARTAKSFRHSLNSWSFYQLHQFIEYKARLQGVPVVYVAPEYTSQSCSRCGLTGNRSGKMFECPDCGHVDHADVNAAFNIALRHEGVSQSVADRDVTEGSVWHPWRGNSMNAGDPRTPRALAVGVCQGSEW